MSKLTISSVIRDLQRKQYIEAMVQTKYGWEAEGEFKHVGCPDDLDFIKTTDMKYCGKCFMDCKDCWEYVLNNKWE